MNDISPLKMSIQNLDTGANEYAQYNPTTFKEVLRVSWNRIAVMGLSHKPMQYQQTDNHTFSFALEMRASSAGDNSSTQDRMEEIQRKRRYLLSLCYSSRAKAATNIAGGSPPRCLFVWPGMVSITAVISSLEMSHTLFNVKARTSYFTTQVELEEIRDARLYSEDVLQMGTFRSFNPVYF